MSDHKCNEHWPDFYDDCAACGAADAWSSANKRIAELEAELKWLQREHVKICSSESKLREAITGWEGYAHKQGEYVDDIGEYFAALLEGKADGKK